MSEAFQHESLGGVSGKFGNEECDKIFNPEIWLRSTSFKYFPFFAGRWLPMPPCSEKCIFKAITATVKIFHGSDLSVRKLEPLIFCGRNILNNYEKPPTQARAKPRLSESRTFRRAPPRRSDETSGSILL